MEWYEVLLGAVGTIGGVSGLISIYKAKPEKVSVEIANMKSMLDEAHKMFDEMKGEKESVSKEFHDYKVENDKRADAFEKRLDKAEDEVFYLKGVIIRGYSCKLPEKLEDCPVIREYEKKHCEECPSKWEGK